MPFRGQLLLGGLSAPIATSRGMTIDLWNLHNLAHGSPTTHESITPSLSRGPPAIPRIIDLQVALPTQRLQSTSSARTCHRYDTVPGCGAVTMNDRLDDQGPYEYKMKLYRTSLVLI